MLIKCKYSRTKKNQHNLDEVDFAMIFGRFPFDCPEQFPFPPHMAVFYVLVFDFK